MTVDPLLEVSRYQRGEVFYLDGENPTFIPSRASLDRWKASIVRPGKANQVESLMRLVTNDAAHRDTKPAFLLTHLQTRRAAEIMWGDPDVALCPGIFPQNNRLGWLLFADIVDLAILAPPGEEDPVRGRGLFIPMPTRAIMWCWVDDNTISLNLYPAGPGKFRTEVWTTGEDGEQHAAVLDHAGGARFLACAFAAMGLGETLHAGDDDDGVDA